MSHSREEAERAERSFARKKAREEIRNAVRKVITESGIDISEIQSAAKAMAEESARSAMKSFAKGSALEVLMRRVVIEEMNNLLAANSHSRMAEMIAAEIKKAASETALKFIEANIAVRLKEPTW